MNIRFLETALWLARLKSMRAVSDKLHVSQTGVSSRIEALEQELAVRLFVRDESGYRPTEEGQQFLLVAARIVDAYHDLRQRLSRQGGVRGSVRVGMVPALAYTLLPAFMRQLQQHHPLLQLELRTEVTSRLIADVQGGRLDLALCVDDGMPIAGAARTALLGFAMGFVASPMLGVSCAHPLGVQQLAGYPLIGYTSDACGEKHLCAYLSGVDLAAVTLYRSNALATMIHMACSGLGIAPVPLLAVQRELEAGLLQPVPVQQPLWRLNYQAVHAASPVPASVAALVQLAAMSAQALCAVASAAHAWPAGDPQEPSGKTAGGPQKSPFVALQCGTDTETSSRSLQDTP